MTKKVLMILAVLTVALGAYAQSELGPGDANNHKFAVRGYAKVTGQAGAQNLTNHGGPVITAPKVVYIFWGFGTGTSYTTAM